MTSTAPTAQEQDFYTWCDFKRAVLDLCPNDKNRLGMKDYLPRLIREAVIDLQQFIPSYNNRHETLYFQQDFTEDGEAMVGTLPPKSDLQSVWLFDFGRNERWPVKDFDWERRFELVHAHRRGHEFQPLCNLTTACVQAIELINRLPVLNHTHHHRHGLIAVDPQHETFYLAPKLKYGWALSVHWNGRKLDFKEQELVPFDEEASYAVANWVQAKIALTVDRDSQRSNDFMRDYLLARTNIFLALKDSGSTDKK